MKCPQCNSKTLIIETRRNDTHVYRRRKCTSCTSRFNTHETYFGVKSPKEKARVFKVVRSSNHGFQIKTLTVEEETNGVAKLVDDFFREEYVNLPLPNDRYFYSKLVMIDYFQKRQNKAMTELKKVSSELEVVSRFLVKYKED